MQINSVNNNSFGARFVAPPLLTPPLNPRQITTNALAKIKQISLDNGLSPKIYKKIIQKAHEIFPSNDDLISIQPIGTNDKFLVGVERGINYDAEVFRSSTKYCASEFIRTLRTIKERMAAN